MAECQNCSIKSERCEQLVDANKRLRANEAAASVYVKDRNSFPNYVHLCEALAVKVSG